MEVYFLSGKQVLTVLKEKIVRQNRQEKNRQKEVRQILYSFIGPCKRHFPFVSLDIFPTILYHYLCPFMSHINELPHSLAIGYIQPIESMEKKSEGGVRYLITQPQANCTFTLKVTAPNMWSSVSVFQSQFPLFTLLGLGIVMASAITNPTDLQVSFLFCPYLCKQTLDYFQKLLI